MSGNMRGTMPWMAPELFPVVTSMRNSGVMVSHLLPVSVTDQSLQDLIFEQLLCCQPKQMVHCTLLSQ